MAEAEKKQEKETVSYKKELIIARKPTGEEIKTIAITYYARGLAPKTLFIAEEEATPEKIQELIKLDVKKRREAKLESIEL